MSSSRRRYDAIVIGGGFAGLTAARELSWLGLATVLLEARGRLGGRTWTRVHAGELVELGGAWVHWMQPFIWNEITRYGLALVEGPAAELYVLPDGRGGYQRTEPDPAMRRMQQLFVRFLGPAQEPLSRPLGACAENLSADGFSIADRFDQLGLSSADRAVLAGPLVVLGGGPLEQSALATMHRWWALCHGRLETLWDVLQRFRIKGGMESLVAALAGDAAFEHRLASEVIAVNQDDRQVNVLTRDGTRYSAAVGAVATPVNVWPTLHFSPPLPDPWQSVPERGYQSSFGRKALIHARGSAPSLVAHTDTPALALATLKREGEDQWLAAFGAEPAFDPSDRTQIAVLLRQIAPELDLVEIVHHDWTRDQFARGAWASMPPGEPRADYVSLGRPFGRLVFATSEIATGWRDTVDGAIESGLRAGRRLAAFVG